MECNKKLVFSQFLYQFAGKAIQIIAFLFLLLLFSVNFIWTSYSLDMESQKVLIKTDSPLQNIFFLFISLLLVFGLNYLLCRKPDQTSRILKLFVPCHIFFWCAIQLVFSRTVPAADAYSVYHCAEEIAGGNLSCIQPSGSYLSYYPQQIGLLSMLELLFRFFRLLPINFPYYHLLKIVYAFFLWGIVMHLYRICELLKLRKETCNLLLLICCLHAPLIMYAAFLYSEIPSFYFFTLGIIGLLRVLSKRTDFKAYSVKSILFLLTGMPLSVLLRKNSLIFIIAVMIVLFFCWLAQYKERRDLLILGLATLLLSFSILPFTIKLYEWRAGNPLRSGVPAMSYFAMGMQESSRAAGWYNGFNFNTYNQTGMNSEETISISKEAISERINYFAQNPSYCAAFYGEKFLSQWADGTYACRQATLATFGGRSQFFHELYEGKYSICFITYCNAFQLLLLLGGLVFFAISLFRQCRISGTQNSCELELFCLLICALGGLLFHMLWEANSRYIFLYGLCLLPYCADGLTSLYSLLLQQIKKGRVTRSGNK